MVDYQGSCHCGAVKFSFVGETITKGLRCTCSICVRKGALMSAQPIAPEHFTIVRSVYISSGRRRQNIIFARAAEYIPFMSRHVSLITIVPISVVLKALIHSRCRLMYSMASICSDFLFFWSDVHADTNPRRAVRMPADFVLNARMKKHKIAFDRIDSPYPIG